MAVIPTLVLLHRINFTGMITTVLVSPLRQNRQECPPRYIFVGVDQKFMQKNYREHHFKKSIK